MLLEVSAIRPSRSHLNNDNNSSNNNNLSSPTFSSSSSSSSSSTLRKHVHVALSQILQMSFGKYDDEPNIKYTK